MVWNAWDQGVLPWQVEHERRKGRCHIVPLFVSLSPCRLHCSTWPGPSDRAGPPLGVEETPEPEVEEEEVDNGHSVPPVKKWNNVFSLRSDTFSRADKSDREEKLSGIRRTYVNMMQHVRPSWPRVGKANATRIGNSVRTSFNAPKQLHPTIHRSNIVQKHIHDLVECRPFSLLVGALVTLNCVVIGLSSHDALMSARDCYVSSCDRAEDTEAWLTFAEIGFSAVFCFEFILRILSGQFFHCSSSHWKWSFLDFVMGMECVAEVALITFNFRLGYVRTIRLLRLARTVQMIRLLKFAKLFRTLRLMLLAICKSLVPLLWAMVVLVAIIFGFSVLFLEAVSEYLSDAGEQDEDAVAEMMRFFDGMPMAMLSLFMSITGGVSWIEVVDVLLVVHTFYAVMMVVFVCILATDVEETRLKTCWADAA